MDNHHLHIIVERNVRFVEGLLEQFGTVEYLAPEEISAERVQKADALFIRTRNRCDAALLDGSQCRFIGTATIGTDHIDLPYCASRGITAVNAPGCNAPAVAQYVMASVLAIANRPIEQYTIGIIGVGHVGSIVERWARRMGMEVLVNDPPRQAAEGGDNWSTLDEIAERADIITVHTPLDATTRHLLDDAYISTFRRSPIVINAARGPIADTDALIRGIDSGKIHHLVIDCWENEPDISRELLRRATIATPHIAGYSLEGKIRAARMVLDEFSRTFSLPHIEMPQSAPAGAASKVSPAAIARSYHPEDDTARLKAAPETFETLRNTYALRHEV
ncbi:MAG: 4-phosphoerythronate dehydrogenase [Bacteroides sp.]|nr:4-phosphoerythronate dehydrogenase [Bacteroides sp.]MCM1457473.1 4-phosphoerythronate dehydrogenase [Lachnoclostridium sp.]